MQTPPTQHNVLLTIAGLICYSGLLITLVFFANIELFKIPKSAAKIDAGERYLGNFDSPPDHNDRLWHNVDLPDDWRKQALALNDAWYRFSVPKQLASKNPVSLYIPTVRQNVAVYVNGNWVGQGGPFLSGHTRVWHQPQLYQFSPSLLNRNDNTITLRLRTHRESSGYLSSIYIGQQQLSDAWHWRNWVKVDLLTIIAHFFIIIGLLNITMWALRPRETFYLWYALAALVWGCQMLPFTSK